jgi:hypothetical protein
LSPSVILEQFPTTCAMFFQALPATAGRVQAMVAGCVLSTRGLWVGPGICNEVERGTTHETWSISAHTFGLKLALNLSIMLISLLVL